MPAPRILDRVVRRGRECPLPKIGDEYAPEPCIRGRGGAPKRLDLGERRKDESSLIVDLVGRNSLSEQHKGQIVIKGRRSQNFVEVGRNLNSIWDQISERRN